MNSFKLNTWTWIDMPKLIAADGTEYGFDIRMAKSRNLLIYLHGGGGSFNEHTAARPFGAEGVDPKDTYYYVKPWHYGAELKHFGIMSDEENSPFYDWNKISIPYSNADFHCGNNDFPYTDLNGNPATMYHHGYHNLHAVLDKALDLLGFVPENLLVCGCSAGGFGTAIMADSIITHIQNTKKTVVCVDSASLARADWKNIVSNVWKAPQEICDRIHSNNITLDCLEALHQKYADRVKISYIGSMRDATLAEFAGIDIYGKLHATKELGGQYETDLKAMLKAMPYVNQYIFDIAPQSDLRLMNLTKHCILLDKECAFYRDEKNVTPIEWLTGMFA